MVDKTTTIVTLCLIFFCTIFLAILIIFLVGAYLSINPSNPSNNNTKLCTGLDINNYNQFKNISFMNMNDTLNQCELLKSPNGGHILIMQTDGNLVIYNTTTNNSTWSTGTNNKGVSPRQFVYQSDGNLVLYDNNKSALWFSGTNGKPSSVLTLQDDGNLVLYNGNSPVWNTGTNGK